LRERGIDGIGVGDIMKEAGLSVGGFYKHFESRDALVTPAFVMALQDIEHIEDALKTKPQRKTCFERRTQDSGPRNHPRNRVAVSLSSTRYAPLSETTLN
jgi:AcrR family transcriptional regulator